MQRISTATAVPDKFGAGKDGFTDGDVIGGIPATDLEAILFDNLQEEIANVVEGAGIVLNGATLTQLRQAVKRLFGGNVTTVNAANSPLALTADHAGLVIMDATAGNIVANLPAVNVIAQPVRFTFVRADATANSATINRAGADTFLGGATSVTVSGQGTSRSIVGNAVAIWLDTSTSPAASEAGNVFFRAANTAPTGSLKANGALVSRTTYAALFAVIGTTFGVGDGATTFALPDLRGEFIRGWDDARGVDSGRVFGSAQTDDLKSHTHTVSTPGGGFTSGGTTATAGAGVSGATGGAETRPRNIALLACIKF